MGVRMNGYTTIQIAGEFELDLHKSCDKNFCFLLYGSNTKNFYCQKPTHVICNRLYIQDRSNNFCSSNILSRSKNKIYMGIHFYFLFYLFFVFDEQL